MENGNLTVATAVPVLSIASPTGAALAHQQSRGVDLRKTTTLGMDGGREAELDELGRIENLTWGEHGVSLLYNDCGRVIGMASGSRFWMSSDGVRWKSDRGEQRSFRFWNTADGELIFAPSETCSGESVLEAGIRDASTTRRHRFGKSVHETYVDTSSKRTSETMFDAGGDKRAARYVDESSGRVRVELYRGDGTVYFVDYFDQQRRFSVRKFVGEGRGAFEDVLNGHLYWLIMAEAQAVPFSLTTDNFAPYCKGPQLNEWLPQWCHDAELARTSQNISVL